jgi:hypothetical protein
MEIFEKNKKIVVVTPGGVLKGKVIFYNDGKYFLHTTIVDADGYLVKLNRVKKSHVYPIEDYGRASKFFESRYL